MTAAVVADARAGDDPGDAEGLVERPGAEGGDDEVDRRQTGRHPGPLQAEEGAGLEQVEAVGRQREGEPEERGGDEGGLLGREFAALVDQPDHRRGEDKDGGGGGHEDEEDLAHPVGHRRPQVLNLAAGGEAGQGREEHGGDRHREDPLRQLVDPERLVHRRRRLVADEAAEEAVDQQVEVDQAEADRHRQHQQQDAAHVGVAPLEAPFEFERRIAQVEGRDHQLDQGADEDPDRVGVDAVLAVEGRRQQDDDGDDRQVPEQRGDREGAEAVVAVEDADDDAADPEQDQDREEDLREGDRQVRISPSKPGAKSGMITGASRTKRAVIAPRTSVTSSSRVEARRNASR